MSTATFCKEKIAAKESFLSCSCTKIYFYVHTLHSLHVKFFFLETCMHYLIQYQVGIKYKLGYISDFTDYD